MNYRALVDPVPRVPSVPQLINKDDQVTSKEQREGKSQPHPIAQNRKPLFHALVPVLGHGPGHSHLHLRSALCSSKHLDP